MTDSLSPRREDLRALRFACSCASATSVAADPWVAIVKQGKLADGTKELILNALHQQPRSIAQLAQLLHLSPPAVHRHVGEMLASELIHEVPIPASQRRSPTERHYRPAFPIVLAEDRRVLQPVLEDLTEAFADAFRSRQGQLEEAFARTGLAARGESFAALLHYCYAAAARLARERLEEAGDLSAWPEHGDGSRWVWWAEEPHETEVTLTTRTIHDGSDAHDEGGG
jgi:DNA-binding transcriptional ArsR family regulator